MKGFSLPPKAPLIISIVVGVASLSLQGWTWFGRYPVIAREHAQAQKIVDLESEVDRLEKTWPTERENRINIEYADAIGSLFSGDPNGATWAAQLKEPSNSKSLSVGVKPDKAIPPQDEALAEHLVCVPTLWEFRSNLQGTSLFGEVLRFLRELDEDRGRRVEIVDLLLKGNGESVSEARATLRLWFVKEAPAAPMITQVSPTP